MKKKRLPKSMSAVTALLVFSIIGTWLISMVCLTVVTAQEMYDVLYERSQNYAASICQQGILQEFYDASSVRYQQQYERPDFLEYQMFSKIGSSTASLHTGGHYATFVPSTGNNRHKLIRDISYPLETALVFYDAEGKLLHSSEDDVLYFDYYTQDEWDAGMDTVSGLHYGFINISQGKNAENWQDDPYLRFRTAYAGTQTLQSQRLLLRVTGYFDGTELKPVVMHYATDAQIMQAVENDSRFSTGPDSYTYLLSDVDKTGKLEWQLQFDRSKEYAGNDLVTVYIDRPEMWDYSGKPLVYEGEEYESLAAFAESLDLSLTDHLPSHGSIWKLNELLIFDRWIAYGEKSAAAENPPVDFYLVTAVRSSPLACAASALRNIYIVTGLLALIVFICVRGSLRKHLIVPLQSINEAMSANWAHIPTLNEKAPKWKEPYELWLHYRQGQDILRNSKNEITRLNTALNYAKTAEQNRRQMTSNIAHALKTPLAVIHSYAEGLKEHIAEEKRDQYMDVILEETQRTDAMVLEMLDLSRLEAGKVKLSRDEFSLAGLTESIFEKLEIAAQAKNLQINYDFAGPCHIIADENRIWQVVENFATNAVKYTPNGGHITVRIQNHRGKTTLSMENDSPPLSGEALAKVWGTFYRTDESHAGSGTGLGLAIAKNIIELHGGTCSAQNTSSGVAFSFTI